MIAKMIEFRLLFRFGYVGETDFVCLCIRVSAGWLVKSD